MKKWLYLFLAALAFSTSAPLVSMSYDSDNIPDIEENEDDNDELDDEVNVDASDEGDE